LRARQRAVKETACELPVGASLRWPAPPSYRMRRPARYGRELPPRRRAA